MKYTIIGNGVAGTEAAISIRKHDLNSEITILSESKHPFYYRPRLIDYLAGKVSLDDFTIYKSDFYQKKRIDCILDTHVEDLFPDEHMVVAGNGTEYTYDKLLLATGAECFMLPIPGIDKKGVFKVRGVDDCDAILEYCKGLSEVVVVGGGLLGLETADCLRSMGKKVIVIEVAEWLLPFQLDQKGSSCLLTQLEEKGLSFLLKETVVSIEGRSKVEGLILKSGREIKTHAVIISAGIRSRNRLAERADIKINRGVVVDDVMQTSVEDIYSAGDQVEHNGILYGIWPAAREQGMAAGSNMAGVVYEYTGTKSSTTLKVTGIDLFSAGDFNAPDSEILYKQNKGIYQKFLIKDDQLIGAIVLGDAEDIKKALRIFQGKESVDQLKKLV